MHIGLIYGVFWILAIAGYCHAPRFIKGTALVIPLYLVTVAVWGFWVEVRLLQPLYPEIIGLGLSYLYPPGRAERIPSV